MWQVFILLIVVIDTGFCFVDSGATKYWRRNTNLFNKDNWKAQQLPCPSDRIIFPKATPIVSMLKSVDVSQIIMPQNGEFIFGPDMNISAVPVRKMHTPSCPGKDAIYVRTKPLSWFDPANWCEKLITGECVKIDLHANAVPSKFDSAVFPSASDSYYVDIDYDDAIVVGKLNFRNEWQTTHGFRIFVSSPDGQKEFVNSAGHYVPTITVLRTGCTNVKGCVPNTLSKKLFQKICSKVTCPKSRCATPITVVGSCCPWCGSVVLAKTGDTFAFNSFATQIRSSLSAKKDVRVSIMKPKETSVQVTLTDDKGGEAVHQVIYELETLLENDKEKFGLASYSVISSKGPMLNPQAQKGVTMNAKVAIVVVFIIFAVVVLFLVGAAVCRKARNGELTLPNVQRFLFRRPQQPFRFSWTRGGSAEASGASPGVVQIELSSPGLSFQNPVYRSPDLNVTPIDDTYDEPPVESSVLTNPAFQPSKSGERKPEEGQSTKGEDSKKKEKEHSEEEKPKAAEEKDGDRGAPAPGTLVFKSQHKLEVTNLAFRPDEEDASKA